FRIENRDTFPWTSCLLSLNSHGISSLKLEVDTIKSGLTEALHIQSTEFVDDDGKKLDPTTSDLARLDLDCETPHGHRYYGGEFGSATPPTRGHARQAALRTPPGISYHVLVKRTPAHPRRT